jgi:transcriptional regulator with XRE-family HTH domain
MTLAKTKAGVGRRLASARVLRGLSQGTLGRLAGVAPSYLSRIENGRIEPSFSMVQRIAAAMGLKLDDLMSPDRRKGSGPNGCPISKSGLCMLDLVRSEAQPARSVAAEGYTVREIKLLQRLSTLMRIATPERLRAVEVVIEDLLSARIAEQNGTALENR